VNDEIVWQDDDLAFSKAANAWQTRGNENMNINHDANLRAAIRICKLPNTKFSTAAIASIVRSVKYTKTESSLGTPALSHK